MNKGHADIRPQHGCPRGMVGFVKWAEGKWSHRIGPRAELSIIVQDDFAYSESTPIKTGVFHNRRE